MQRSVVKYKTWNILKMVKLLRLSYYSLNSNPKVVNPTTVEDAVAVEGVGDWRWHANCVALEATGVGTLRIRHSACLMAFHSHRRKTQNDGIHQH